MSGRSKEDLQKLKMEDFDLIGSNKLFTNRSLCSYYKVLWSKSKKLRNLGKIHSFLSLVIQSKSKLMKVMFRCR